MPTHPYQEILNEVFNHIQYLPLEEQLKLIHDLENMVRAQANVKPMHNLTELEGLGAEIWEEVDVEAYINRERDSWEALPEKKHSVTEFRGMAKDLWKDVDVDAYIREERNSWDKEDNKG